MRLREHLLYGKDKQFSNWFHQHCIWVRNNAQLASRSFHNRDLAKIIDQAKATQLDEVIINYVSVTFILYLIFTVAEDKGDDYLTKRLTSMASIINSIFGPAVLSLYEVSVNDISTRHVSPESSVAHLLVDPLAVPLSRESQALETVFEFLSKSVEEYYLPVLEEAYSHNLSIPYNVLRGFGH